MLAPALSRKHHKAVRSRAGVQATAEQYGALHVSRQLLHALGRQYSTRACSDGLQGGGSPLPKLGSCCQACSAIGLQAGAAAVLHKEPARRLWG